MDEAWKKARREELWRDVVLENARKAGIAVDIPRVEVAAKLLEIQRVEYTEAQKQIDPEDSGSNSAALFALGKAKLTWQLMTQETYGWLIESSPGDSLYPRDLLQNELQGVARECVGSQLAAGGPLHRRGIDPVPVMLPRWVAEAISDGFDGLVHGETQPVFQAAQTTKKGDAYTWDKMRLRAVQHVAFLTGSGSTKESALKRVELTTNIKAGTLRRLETNFRKDAYENLQIEWAKRAGEISVVLEFNPDFGTDDGNTLDANVYAILLELQREPLGAFGLDYRSYGFDTRQV